MTKPSEVLITDKEVERFEMRLISQSGFHFKEALAAFLAARVPDAKPNSGISLHVGFNACRDKVLKGV